ncbi:MAG TPA: hypothetical protein DHV59_11600 [Oxalobacteraceae bacterium]|nr:hypothetical protein [Oxalobacteraceae bacterium]
MGTSQSSGGPGQGVPMVPPWTPNLPPDAPPQANPPVNPPGANPPLVPPPVPPAPVPNAPPGRFGGARRSLGEFSRSGSRGDLQRGLGHYVRSGYGGTRTASRRFGGTISTAQALGGALAGMADPAIVPGSPLDPALLAGRTADEVMDAIVEAVRPVDGTQDAEAERASIRDSLSELLTQFPNADLLNLTPEERNFVIERFTANDVCHRFELDVGQAIIENAPNATMALGRIKEIRAYIKESVSAAFRNLRNAGRNLTTHNIAQVVRDALYETFEVFEGYAA